MKKLWNKIKILFGFKAKVVTTTVSKTCKIVQVKKGKTRYKLLIEMEGDNVKKYRLDKIE